MDSRHHDIICDMVAVGPVRCVGRRLLLDTVRGAEVDPSRVRLGGLELDVGRS